MSKSLKIVGLILISLLILGLFFTEAEAGKYYYATAKRSIKKTYYKIQWKPRPTVKLKVPYHRQQHALSCELAALKMALDGKGVDIPENVLISQIPFEPMWGNPHRGFVGNIDGKMLKTGYGVYWGPIQRLASTYREAQAFEHGSVTLLSSEIQRGNPIIVWGYAGSGRGRRWVAPDGTPILGISGEHARVAIGFAGPVGRPSGFYLLDPIYGEIYWSSSKLAKNASPFGFSGVIVR